MTGSDSEAGHSGSSAGYRTWATMTAGHPAARARRKGTSSFRSSSPGGRPPRGGRGGSRRVFARAREVLGHGDQAFRQGRMDEGLPARGDRSGSSAYARSPTTMLAGSVRQSRTGVSPESNPAARSSRAIARATCRPAPGSPVRPTVPAGGKRVNGGGMRWTRPPSWSTSTSTSGPSARAAPVSVRTASRVGQFRAKSTMPPSPLDGELDDVFGQGRCPRTRQREALRRAGSPGRLPPQESGCRRLDGSPGDRHGSGRRQAATVPGPVAATTR